MDSKKLDLIAIGDTVVDAFIKIKDAHVNCQLDGTECELCMAFGSKVPYESVDVLYGVGNSANAAVSAARLGLSTGMVTYLGDDADGRASVDNFASEGVDTSNIILEKNKKTNYHYVLWYEDERTILIKHETFKTFLPDIGVPRWIYLSSFGEHVIDIYDELAALLKANPSIKLAFQPGTFQMKLGTERLSGIYMHTELFCCNVEEAQLILNMHSKAKPDHNIRNVSHVKSLLIGLHELGPKVVTITDGKYGAYLYNDDKYSFMPNYPDIDKPYERTGAGDAFASTFTAMLALGHTPEVAITYAPINSMNVVRYVGAQKGLLKLKELKEYHDEAPSEYKLEIIY